MGVELNYPIKAIPNSVSLTFEIDGEVKSETYIRLNSLSPSLRERVLVYPNEPVRSLPAPPPLQLEDSPQQREIFVAENFEVEEFPKVTEVPHKTLESWLLSLLALKGAKGEVSPCDNFVKASSFGFIHHPEEGAEGFSSSWHLFHVSLLQGANIDPGIASRFERDPGEILHLLRTTPGRHLLITGTKLPTHEEDSKRDAIIETYFGGMYPYRTEVPGRNQELSEGRVLRTLRPEWVPKGWGRFVLPADKDRVGIFVNEYKESKMGAFTRRDGVMFRIFDDGTWDKCGLSLEKWGGWSGYALEIRGKAQTPEQALIEVLPLVEAIAPGPLTKFLSL